MPDLTEFETARIPRASALHEVTPVELRAIADRMENVASGAPPGAAILCPLGPDAMLVWRRTTPPGPGLSEVDELVAEAAKHENKLAAAIARLTGPSGQAPILATVEFNRDGTQKIEGPVRLVTEGPPHPDSFRKPVRVEP